MRISDWSSDVCSSDLDRTDMINNDVLRSIRYMLDLSDGKVVEITHLADPGFPIDKADVEAFLKKDNEDGYVECGNAVLAHFLDGLVIHRRETGRAACRENGCQYV